MAYDAGDYQFDLMAMHSQHGTYTLEVSVNQDGKPIKDFANEQEVARYEFILTVHGYLHRYTDFEVDDVHLTRWDQYGNSITQSIPEDWVQLEVVQVMEKDIERMGQAGELDSLFD